MAFIIRVPSSSANIGPGFDVLGLALPIYLEVHVTVKSQASSTQPFNCLISREGEDAQEISLDPKVNLITRVALYVLGSHDRRTFPVETKVHIKNMIPLGRGLGSSAAAVTAGVILANEVGGLGLGKARILDYCLMIEHHPDNVAAALYGGFVAGILNDPESDDIAQKDELWDKVIPASNMELELRQRPEKLSASIGLCHSLQWAKEIKALVVIPDFEVPTSEARAALPPKYSSRDAKFNLQRAVVLASALAQSPPDPDKISLAMQDRMHQPYRLRLVHGLTEVLHSMSPSTQPGFLGLCLSGAGPTILALVTANFSDIAERIIDQFRRHNISCQWKVLEPDEEGATVERTGPILTPVET